MEEVMGEKQCDYCGSNGKPYWHEPDKRWWHEGGVLCQAPEEGCRRAALADLHSSLAEENEPDFEHRPRGYAYESARRLFEESRLIVPPAMAPDGDGGLRIEWKTDNKYTRCVRVIIPGEPTERSYIYHRDGQGSGVEDLTPERLSYYVETIIQSPLH